MRIGVPREVKNNEFRVALTPAGAQELIRHGHQVLVQTGAGTGSSLPDEDYKAVGATLIADPDEVWGQADMVMKVKEPISEEYHRLRPGLVLFTYLHLAADEALTRVLLERGVTSIAYETVELDNGQLPLLAPMSEVAGRLAPQVGAHSLMAPQGGRGVLMGGVPGVYGARVVVLGAGVAGLNAARMAMGMQAQVTLVDRNIARLRQIEEVFGGRCQTVASNEMEINLAVRDADMVIGAVLIPGARAPKLVTDHMVSTMKPGSVLVDISIDQGGCFEGSRPTTHADPTFPVHQSLYYCVANMPGSVPHTSTFALTNVTVPYALHLADQGWQAAAAASAPLAKGLSTHAGLLVNEPVAVAHEMTFTPLQEVIGA